MELNGQNIGAFLQQIHIGHSEFAQLWIAGVGTAVLHVFGKSTLRLIESGYFVLIQVDNGAVVIVQRAHDLLDPAQVLHLERGDEKVALNSVSIFLVLIQKGVGHEAVSQIGGGTVLRAEAPLGLFPVGAVQKNASGPQRADVPLFILRPHQGIFFIVVVGPHRVPIYGGDLLRRGVFCQSSGYQAQRQNERQEYTEKFAFFHYEITSFVAPLPYRKFIRSSITVL